ncbi:MAG TPA: hypothetical protein PKE27_20955 [Povalibacter sp.]|uniref:hypothetical protein n=1 Tax=Povalibacter sp. TaxID=1962978 RepID=UPI002C17D7FB|nr:hypothetical protein [Povalibacter sp.]HMN47060.1 hypothetical protein [Povalibacter sp.]
MRTTKFAVLCAACALAGCAGNGDGLDENGRPEEGDSGELQPTFQSIQDRVFTPVCTGCHAGAAAPLGLRLDEGASYALLVNASSVEVPALLRVQPGNPDASYLIRKIEGTAAVGGRMPLNAPALSRETIAVIRQWIVDGAAGASSTASSKAGFELAHLTSTAPQNGEIVQPPLREIVVASNVELDTSRLQSNPVALRMSGGDGDFDSGNEIAIPVDVTVRVQQPTVIAIVPRVAAFPADTYELRISGSGPVALTDYGARAIDGDGNGSPGGDFVLRFTVETAR